MRFSGYSTGITGKEKVAIVLISLGKDVAAKIFQHFSEEEIEELTMGLASTPFVEAELKESVLNEFYEICLAQDFISEGGIEYAKVLLDNTLGAEKAADIMSRLHSTVQVRPFEYVRKSDPEQILNILRDESEQTIALVLSYLKPKQAAEILRSLAPEMQSDIVERVALMDRTSPDYIKEIEKVLEKKLAKLGSEDYTAVGGIDSIVDILNAVDIGTEKRVFENLGNTNAELVEEIKRHMFVFEDIIKLDNPTIQRIVRDLDTKALAIALKGAEEEIKALIFKNMSVRASESLAEEIDALGPVRVKDIEECQQKVVSNIRALEDSGEITITRGEEDEMIG